MLLKKEKQVGIELHVHYRQKKNLDLMKDLIPSDILITGLAEEKSTAAIKQ